jgi:hypothetical protein
MVIPESGWINKVAYLLLALQRDGYTYPPVIPIRSILTQNYRKNHICFRLHLQPSPVAMLISGMILPKMRRSDQRRVHLLCVAVHPR